MRKGVLGRVEKGLLGRVCGKRRAERENTRGIVGSSVRAGLIMGVSVRSLIHTSA